MNKLDFKIRSAYENDSGIILELIRGLAEYEQLSHEVTATKEGIYDSLLLPCSLPMHGVLLSKL